MSVDHEPLQPDSRKFFESESSAQLQEIVRGLQKPQKTLSPKFFYDERGSTLFDQICETEEYYPTQAEISILQNEAKSIAQLLGPKALLLELGAGSGIKAEILLNHLSAPSAYIPIDISSAHLVITARTVKARFPDLHVFPLCLDFTQPFDLPYVQTGLANLEIKSQTFLFFGSTLGNFEPIEALHFLRQLEKNLKPKGGLLVGIDLVKDKAVLESAYNDRQGITAQFNLNVLVRLNREFGATFDVQAFQHKAFFNSDKNRVEMHLVSLKPQTVHIQGIPVNFNQGETIHTENSYKYTPESFSLLAEEAGFQPIQMWTDPRRFFAVFYLTTESPVGSRSP